MAKRKIYIGIESAGAKKARVLKTWTVTDEDSLRDTQAEICEFLAEDFIAALDKEIDEGEG
jgi:hypothetical protein